MFIGTFNSWVRPQKGGRNNEQERFFDFIFSNYYPFSKFSATFSLNIEKVT